MLVAWSQAKLPNGPCLLCSFVQASSTCKTSRCSLVTISPVTSFQAPVLWRCTTTSQPRCQMCKCRRQGLLLLREQVQQAAGPAQPSHSTGIKVPKADPNPTPQLHQESSVSDMWAESSGLPQEERVMRPKEELGAAISKSDETARDSSSNPTGTVLQTQAHQFHRLSLRKWVHKYSVTYQLQRITHWQMLLRPLR